MSIILSGKFKNCYGLRDFELDEINFDTHKALIYSPNGVMKTSLAKVFEDISKGQETTDRIFKNVVSEYEVRYGMSVYRNADLKQVEEIYVINSFDESFECRNDSISLLLADTETRQQYDQILSEFDALIREFQDTLAKPSGISKLKIQEQILLDFELPSKSEWIDLFDAMAKNLKQFSDCAVFSNFKYVDVFNEKTARIYEKPSFLARIEDYVAKLTELLSDNDLLSSGFDDYNAEELGKSLEKNNLFKAQHSITLKDGKTVIKDVQDWKSRVSSEVQKLYRSPELTTAFQDLRKQLTANAESKKLRDIITANPEIIKFFPNIPDFKRKMWLHSVLSLGEPFDTSYRKIVEYRDDIKTIYKKASLQKERWGKIVSQFNQRFRVPFEVTIENQVGVLLKDEAPHLRFKYNWGAETADCEKKDLMQFLSMGEKRALYLLYVLFDLERIKSLADQDSKEYLVIADDIADSFDYKNKYAIIEYLGDISSSKNIDLLLLTHNFDFYRTAASRLDIHSENCLIVQKGQTDGLYMSVFGRQTDYFKDRILTQIQNGEIHDDKDKKKCLIASIPFYRNLSEYIQKTDISDYLTCLLHIKHLKQDTDSITVGQLWSKLKSPFGLGDLDIDDKDASVVDLIKQMADSICIETRDETSLENKIVISMAIRLETEKFLESVLTEQDEETTCGGNQTRRWARRAKPYLDAETNRIISDVCLMTPEEIHVNAFMYEPIIDMSDWALKELHGRVRSLTEKPFQS